MVESIFKFMKIKKEQEAKQSDFFVFQNNNPLNNSQIYFRSLLFRLIIAVFFVKTFHKGDQYFQGPQVGHHMIFGTGELSWEWTFKDPVRNPLYPGFFAFGYYLIKLFVVSILPYIQQAFIAAAFDLMLIKLNKFYNGEKTTHLLIFLNYTCWVTLMYFSRTYVNSIQAVLFMIAFYLWTKRTENKNYDNFSRALVVINFAIRGTSILLWAIIWPYQLIKEYKNLKDTSKFIFKNILTIIIMISVSITISSIYYNKLLWVDYNFFYYNVLQNWSCLAGTNQFEAYFLYYQFKIFHLMVFVLLYGVVSIFLSTSNPKKAAQNQKLKQLVLFTVAGLILLSYNSHKQLRFVLSFIPFLFIGLIKGYTEFPLPQTRKLLLILFVASSLYSFGMRNVIVGRGPIETMTYVRDTPHVTDLLLLTGAFGNPLHSFVHRDINIQMITHPYDEVMSGIKTHLDVFYSDPKQFLFKTLEQNQNITHVLTREGQIQIDMQNLQKYNFDLEYEYSYPSYEKEAGAYKIWRLVK